MARSKTYDIFLSHSSLDNDFTNKLHSLLEQAGFNVWYDEKKMKVEEYGKMFFFWISLRNPLNFNSVKRTGSKGRTV